MTYPTFKELTQDTITQMGQVSGSGVQTYTEPLVKLAVNRIFNLLWNKRRWENLWTWEQFQLDGVTGKFTAAVTTVKDWKDIVEFRVGGQQTPITFTSDNEHTLAYTSGSSPIWVTALPWDDADSETKFFKFWPITATGPVDLLVGHRPNKFEDDDDKVPMDYDLMVDGACWWMLEDDGMNPASLEKFKNSFDITYQDITARLGARPKGHGRGRTNGRTVIIQQ